MSFDRRKVQTAVLGDPDSTEPAYMPQEQDEAEAFRAQARQAQASYWCGRWLGGCGGRLVIKVYQETRTVPHFAHQTASEQCTRLNRGHDSADHLYAGRHLSGLLRAQGRADHDPRYLVDAQEICTQLLLPATGNHHRPLRLVFSAGYDPELLALARSPQGRDYEWWIKDNRSLTRTLIGNGIPYRLFRVVQQDGARVVEVASPSNTSTSGWAPPEAVLSPSAPVPRQAPDAASASPEPTTTTDASGRVRSAIRGLQHFLSAGSAKDIRDFRERLRHTLDAHPKPIPADLHGQAQRLLDQAAQALPITHIRTIPSPVRPVHPRRTRHTPTPPANRRRPRQDRERTTAVEASPTHEPRRAPSGERPAEQAGIAPAAKAPTGRKIEGVGPLKVRKRANGLIDTLWSAQRENDRDTYMRARDQLRLIQHEPELPVDLIDAVRDQLNRFPPLEPSP